MTRNRIWAVVLVKGTRSAKQRPSPVMTLATRQRLVLAALMGSWIAGIVVIVVDLIARARRVIRCADRRRPCRRRPHRRGGIRGADAGR